MANLSCIITPESLQGLIKENAPDIKILDATIVMPGSGLDPKAKFETAHIPGAQFFDIEAISDHNSDLPHMLPTADNFAKAVSTLGISNNDHVIIYAQSGMVMGPARAWWMFRVFGHDRVSVLDGGLHAWKAAEGSLAHAAATPTPVTFKAHYRPHLVCNLDKMKDLSASGKALILDARAAERFTGAQAEPRPGLRSGHIPGSRNVPCNSLVDETGRMRGTDFLQEIFGKKGLGSKDSIVATCGSGVTACFLALALYKLGQKDVAVYDGSWSEWGRAALGTPIEQDTI